MPPVAEAETDHSAEQSDELDIQGTERDAEDHEGPPGLGQEFPASDPIGITDPASNPAEPVVEAEESAETPADWFDDSAQKRAEFYGFDADTARSYGSRDALERTFTAMDRQAQKWAELTGQQVEQPEQPSAHQAAPAPHAPTQQQTPQQVLAAFEKYKIDNTDMLDADHLKVLEGINEHYHKVISERDNEYKQYISALAEMSYGLQGQLQQYTSQIQAEESARNERELDTFFAGSGDALKEVFGVVPTHQLGQNSDLRSAREKLWKEMVRQWQVDAQFNRPKLPVNEMAQRIVNALYADKLVSHAKSTARKEIEQQVRAQKSTQIERSSGTKPRPKTGTEAARQFVNSHPLIKAVRSGQF